MLPQRQLQVLNRPPLTKFQSRLSRKLSSGLNGEASVRQTWADVRLMLRAFLETQTSSTSLPRLVDYGRPSTAARPGSQSLKDRARFRSAMWPWPRATPMLFGLVLVNQNPGTAFLLVMGFTSQLTAGKPGKTWDCGTPNEFPQLRFIRRILTSFMW